MHIGIVPVLSPFGGGIYQYSQTMVRVLAELKAAEIADEITVFLDEEDPVAAKTYQDLGVQVTFLGPLINIKRSGVRALLGRTARVLLGRRRSELLWRRLRRGPRGWLSLAEGYEPLFRPELARCFQQVGAELVFYPAPTPLAFEAGIPYVMAIHDLQHRLQPEFPEVSADGEWEAREYLFRNGARHATLLLADSEVGKEDILNCYGPYGVTADRVKVLPFLPACYLSTHVPGEEQQRVLAAHAVPARFLFYPAQFWPHKNHARIVQALELLRQRSGERIPIVFCGSRADKLREQTYQEIVRLIRQLDLQQQIHFLGHVPDADMSVLYAAATALVMPTFFGPTNIPVLEAWAFGCPVITSDIRGIREQVGDAGLLVDPRSPEAIANAIFRVWTDGALRNALAERGRHRLALYGPSDYRARLLDILAEAKARVRRKSTVTP
ncbi:MAG: glycosyltransferase family 1 protein [candidate division WOR-3 bacterium]